MYCDITAVGGEKQDVRIQGLMIALRAIGFFSEGLDVFSLRCD